jgi:hypothetical protein
MASPATTPPARVVTMFRLENANQSAAVDAVIAMATDAATKGAS